MKKEFLENSAAAFEKQKNRYLRKIGDLEMQLDRKILENDKIRVHLHPAGGKRHGPVLWNQEIH